MPDPNRISLFPLKPVPDDDDILFLNDKVVDEERRTTTSGIKTAILGGAAIGGNAAGDILTTNAGQTVTNKRLNSPAINSSAIVVADSQELNILSGASITTAELNHLSGVTSNIQQRFNDLSSVQIPMYLRTYNYGTGTLFGIDKQIISEATLRLPTGVGSFYRVNPDSLVVCVWQEKDTNNWVQLAPSDLFAQTSFSTTTAGPAMTTVLNQISVKLDPSINSKITVTYKLLELPGV